MLWNPKVNRHNYINFAFGFIAYYNKNLMIHISDRLQATEITTLSTKEEVKSLYENVPATFIAGSLDICAA
jgi:hypothetical protein